MLIPIKPLSLYQIITDMMKRHTLFLFLILLVINSCSKTDKNLLSPAKDKELLSQYFTAASVGVISSSSSLKYVLLDPVSQEISNEELQKVIKISPSVPGNVSLTNYTILTFTPDAPLASSQTYTVNIDLKRLDGQRYDQNINYQIKTLMQDMSIEREGIIITEDGSNSIILRIKTADKADPQNLLSCITTNADKKTINELGSNDYQAELTWSKGISSGSSIQYDGKPIGSTSKGDISIFSWDKAMFKILHNQYNNSKKEYNIYFSQTLRKQMDMTGLLTVNGKNAEYTIKDNVLTIFLANIADQKTVKIYINNGIKSQQGLALPASVSYSIDISDQLPAVQFVSEGNYFPSDGDFKIPVKTRALEKLRVVVIEIKQENVKQYLAWNSIDYSDFYTLRKFGKPIFDEVVPLNQGIKDEDGWSVHGIDLSGRVKRNPGSIYHISMEFSPDFTTLACKDRLSKYNLPNSIPSMDYFKFKDSYYTDYFYIDDDNYWADRENPCKLGFYYNKSIAERLFICTDYSVIAKKAGNTYHIALSRLKDLSLVDNASIILYNMQGEVIAEKTTNASGFATFEQVYEDATVVEVRDYNNVTYLVLDTDRSNSMTEFDVAGERSEEDTQFFIYTDRDVYRPGDSVFVNLMINKAAIDLPKGLPITMTFFDMDNMIVDKQVQVLNTDSKLIHSFVLHTQSQAKTGIYRCIFHIGINKIRKNIRIETIKPNTTEVIYSFNNESKGTIYGDVVTGNIHARYLTGYDLANAKIQAAAKVSKIRQPFTGYTNYNFDVFGESSSKNIDLFSLTTNAQGRGSFKSDVSFKTYNTPLKLYVETETTLADGGVGKEGKTVTVSPFTTYVGAVKSSGKGWNGNYTPLDDISFDLVNLTDKGTLNTQETKIDYTLQQSIDSWWVDKYRYSSDGNYISDSSWKDIESNSTTITGKGKLYWNGKKLDDGAYLITFKDTRSGHRSMVYFTVFDSNSKVTGTQPYIVEFETGKESYKIGENIELMLPAIKDGKALVSVERGSRVLEQKWVNLSDSKTKLELSSKDSWAPNIYINVTVVQKYMQKNNDLPLRMYGVKYIRMDANKLPLTPVSNIPVNLESNKTYTFNITEKSGQPMEYTIAFVDEGLLGLTGFKTPNPEKQFNGKFPLLVKTWDLYKDLINWFNGKFAGIISIGGDDVYNPDAIAEINRFKPLVRHLGPFKLNAKGKNTHTVSIPNYVGKVRMMVVAGSADNFGNMEKLIPVKNPIMVQSQLPRSLNVTDKLKLPVSVFRDDNTIDAFNLTTKTDASFIKGMLPSTSLKFSGKEQVTHLLNLEVQNKVGPVKIDIGAQAGSKSMTESTDILVNYPNAYESDTKKNLIEKGKSLTVNIVPKGYREVFTSDMIISGVKVPDFTKYADELIQYPYGCLEQITSRGYAMMYLDKVLALDPKEEKDRQKHLQNVLFEISKLQQPSGKFKYWENGYYDGWSDVYAGNFLTEMKALNNLGMYNDLLEKWLTAQITVANDWALAESSTQYVYENESFIQAFRLYTLAKAGRSAKSGLNRFVTNNNTKNPVTWWLIAGTYKLGGYDTKAKEYMDKAETLQRDGINGWADYSFGSEARNMAIIVEVLSYIQPGQKKLDDYYDAMVEACNNSHWASTQTMGFAYIAAYKYFGKTLGVEKQIKYTISGMAGGDKTLQHSSFEPKVFRIPASDWNKGIKITNQGSGQLYVYQNSRYIDNVLTKNATAEGLHLSVEYYNLTNKATGLDNTKLGDDMIISVTVENKMPLSLTHLALNYKVPSGWELLNPRMYETDIVNSKNNDFQYQDFRDDRVYTFFNMNAGSKKTIQFKAKAAFSGDFFLPAVTCQHMYRGDISASTATSRVVVR